MFAAGPDAIGLAAVSSRWRLRLGAGAVNRGRPGYFFGGGGGGGGGFVILAGLGVLPDCLGLLDVRLGSLTISYSSSG